MPWDLGYREADAGGASVQLIHRGKFKSLTKLQRRWLRRRQAIEPAIGHTKHDHGLQRCRPNGAEGDTLHAVLCAAGYNVRWLLRATTRLGLKAALFCLHFLLALAVA